MNMHIRPVTDLFEDYQGVKQIYDEWKEQKTFTYQTYVAHIRILNELNSVLFVATNNKIIQGSCKVMLEPKLAYGNWVCHIEDVVVKKECRGQGVGTFMMREIIKLCKENKWSDDIVVYKVRLGCKQSLEKFYEQSEFTRSGSDMVCYIPTHMVCWPFEHINEFQKS